VTDGIARSNDRRPAAFVIAVGAAIVVAGLVGMGAGALMAKIAPEDKFSWVGLAVAPLWLLIEIGFELFVGVFELHSRAARIAGTVSLLLGFYATWFLMRPL